MKTTGISAGMQMAVKDLRDPAKAEEHRQRLIEIQHLAALTRGKMHREQDQANARVSNQYFRG